MRKVAALFLVLGMSAGCGGEPADQVIYLVRHAEKTDDGTKDPPLSEAGRSRVAALADLLEESGISRVYSSDYNRTRQTAGPVAKKLGVVVEIYDPRKLDEFAVRLKAYGRSALVVGHSNTTPELVKLLGGDPGEPMGEDEYGRLYRLVIQGSTIRTETATLSE